MADGKSSPFGSAGNGNKGSGRDFTAESGPTPSPGKPASRDFTKETGPTPRTEVAPNPDSIPAGGKDLKADPSGNSAKTTGGGGVTPRKPFKGL